MRDTGALAARSLAHVEPHIQPGVTTAALDAIVRDFMRRQRRDRRHLRVQRVQDVVVHQRQRGRLPGVPSDKVTLKAGDIVNVDVTTVLNGWHGDTSKTFVVGGEDAASDEANRLVRTTQEALRPALSGSAGARLEA